MPKRRANEQSHAEPEAVQLVFDFDSTIVSVEGLDELARIALADDPDRERTVEAIEAITRDGMSGAIGIDESLRRRLAMLTIERTHVDAVVRLLRKRLSPSFRRHAAAVKRNADRIHVVSSGFREYVEPVCRDLGIPPERIHCNAFTWKGQRAVGFDASSPLARPGGKARAVRALRLPGRVVAIGDGITAVSGQREGALDGQPRRPGVRVQLCAAVARRGVCGGGREGEVRPRLRGGLGQGHGPGPVRPALKAWRSGA